MTEEIGILRNILKALQDKNLGNDALWRKPEVAEYLQYGLTRLDAIIARPDFPKPVRVDENAQPRWISGEIKEWVKRTRGEHGIQRRTGRPRQAA